MNLIKNFADGSQSKEPRDGRNKKKNMLQEELSL